MLMLFDSLDFVGYHINVFLTTTFVRRKFMAENVLEITDDNFEDTVLNSDTPIVVDFWAEWCGPCKMIAPSLEQLAEEHVGTFKVGKLNVDDNRETAMKYGIRSIPTLLVIKEGDVAEQIIGAHPKDTLKDKILSAI